MCTKNGTIRHHTPEMRYKNSKKEYVWNIQSHILDLTSGILQISILYLPQLRCVVYN